MKSIRERLRHVKSQSIRYVKDGPPVLVFGLRRGGSTMVTDTICANRGVWFADEPFAMFPNRPGYPQKKERLFVPPNSHFFDLEGAELNAFASFSQSLLNVEMRELGTAPLSHFGFRANRVCSKILNAPWMVDWFEQHTDAQILRVVRHPAAQALSVIRQGWVCPVEAYLARAGFLETHLSDKQTAMAHDIYAEGDPWKLAILDWVITSIPLRSEGAKTWRYEDIILNRSEFIDSVLVQDCGFNDVAAMETAIRKPSGSSRMNTNVATDAIKSGNNSKILNGWSEKIDDDQRQSGQKILDAYDVENYDFSTMFA